MPARAVIPGPFYPPRRLLLPSKSNAWAKGGGASILFNKLPGGVRTEEGGLSSGQALLSSGGEMR